MGRFRTLVQKKPAPAIDPLTIAIPPIIQVSLLAPTLVLALSTLKGVKSSLSEAPLKCKRRELATGPSKKSKKKAWGASFARLPSSSENAELWKLEFSICELDKQVMVDNSSKDHDTSLALMLVVMLLNDVVALFEENSEMIRDLLVMQKV